MLYINSMKITYGFGRGPWLTSVTVGIIAAICFFIAAPFMWLGGLVFLILGFTGFLKRIG